MNKTIFWSRNKTNLQDASNENGGRVIKLPTDLILPNPSQPRKIFDEVDIVSLADSIRQHGLLQPITVRRSSKSALGAEQYYVIAGERRLRAFKMLGRTEIPCILVEISPSESAELAIVENIMRKDLNLFEYAEALATLIEKYQLTQEDLAVKLSTSQSNIANKLRLLRFTQFEQKLILDKGLTERHARSLLRISDTAVRETAIRYIAEHGLNVKDTETYIDTLLMPVQNNEKKTRVYGTADFCKTIDKTLDLVRKRGFQASSERFESETELQIVIHIPKQA